MLAVLSSIHKNILSAPPPPFAPQPPPYRLQGRIYPLHYLRDSMFSIFPGSFYRIWLIGRRSHARFWIFRGLYSMSISLYDESLRILRVEF